MLTRSHYEFPDDVAQPDQIAHGFMFGFRHPNGGQLSGSMKSGKHGGVTTVSLPPIASFRRNQRRRCHVAPMAKACELAKNIVAAGAAS